MVGPVGVEPTTCGKFLAGFTQSHTAANLLVNTEDSTISLRRAVV